jgi:anti-sigma B factor antagonist
MQGIKITNNQVGAKRDIVLLTVSGYVDTTTCHELAKALQDLVAKKQYLLIADLRGVNYISSAGWGVFVGEIKEIRDRGGDLKIYQMIPEVYEVFEMLEFNRIIQYYDSIEEAIDEFDLIRGIDITQSEQLESVKTGTANSLSGLGIATAVPNKVEFFPDQKIAVKDFPLMEKIKLIVNDNPFGGIGSIRRQLRREPYGSVRISLIRLFMILRKMSLESREKRYRFFRSR